MNTESSISKNLTEKNTEASLSKGKELYKQRKNKKESYKKEQRKKDKSKILFRKVGLFILIGLGVAGLIWGVTTFVSTRPKLPPTSQSGHIESSPDSHILDSPMPEAIQKHMLEHADGAGAPGVIVQYNCEDFECESDLVDKLTKLVEEYPDNVYLAPNNYDGRIILTREGKIEILDDFDVKRIRDFIEN